MEALLQKWKYSRITYYYKGELNGEFRSFYLNGNINIKAFYTIGKLDSIFEAYYVNGNLAERGIMIYTPLFHIKTP